VIVTWNSADDLDLCLRAVERQTERSFEVIVVDNASTDGTLEIVRRESPAATVLETGANLGFAEACNRGIAAARGEWIAVLNPDTEVDPGWLAGLMRAARSGAADVGMLQPRVVQRLHPERLACTGIQLFVGGRARDRDVDRPSAAESRGDEVFCPSAAAALYRREMLQRTALSTGIFDRTHFMYFEDLDLGWRCRLAGWSAVYVPGAVVRHTGQSSARRRGRHFAELQYRKNRLRTLLKNASTPMIVSAAPVVALDVLRALRWQGPAAVREFLAAASDGIRLRPEVTRLMTRGRGALERRWVSLSPDGP
jgi:GT2 family glycosyltransferase